MVLLTSPARQQVSWMEPKLVMKLNLGKPLKDFFRLMRLFSDVSIKKYFAKVVCKHISGHETQVHNKFGWTRTRNIIAPIIKEDKTSVDTARLRLLSCVEQNHLQISVSLGKTVANKANALKNWCITKLTLLISSETPKQSSILADRCAVLFPEESFPVPNLESLNVRREKERSSTCDE